MVAHSGWSDDEPVESVVSPPSLAADRTASTTGSTGNQLVEFNHQPDRVGTNQPRVIIKHITPVVLANAQPTEVPISS